MVRFPFKKAEYNTGIKSVPPSTRLPAFSKSVNGQARLVVHHQLEKD